MSMTRTVIRLWENYFNYSSFQITIANMFESITMASNFLKGPFKYGNIINSRKNCNKTMGELF